MEKNFCKIMFPGFSTTKLRIPPHFVEHISAEAYGNATILQDLNGNHWRIKLCRTADGVFLRDGWQDFVKDHSIYDHNFLLFGYDGKTCFDVKIFDKSACEREYEFNVEPNQEPAFFGGIKSEPSMTSTESDQEASRDDPGHFLPTYKPKGRPKKARRVNVKLTHKPLSKPMCTSSRRRPVTEEERKIVLEKAGSFTSEFPYFSRCLSAADVYMGSSLYISLEFATRYIHIGRKTQITLKNREGQAWKVNCLKTTRGWTSLSRGWKKFAHDNKLEEADICIFELVGEFEMLVHIFQAVQDS